MARHRRPGACRRSTCVCASRSAKSSRAIVAQPRCWRFDKVPFALYLSSWRNSSWTPVAVACDYQRQLRIIIKKKNMVTDINIVSHPRLLRTAPPLLHVSTQWKNKVQESYDRKNQRGFFFLSSCNEAISPWWNTTGGLLKLEAEGVKSAGPQVAVSSSMSLQRKTWSCCVFRFTRLRGPSFWMRPRGPFL